MLELSCNFIPPGTTQYVALSEAPVSAATLSPVGKGDVLCPGSDPINLVTLWIIVQEAAG